MGFRKRLTLLCVKVQYGLLLAFVIMSAFSCKKNQDKAIMPKKEKIEKQKINDFLIFENDLTKKNINGAEYSNIVFKKDGAVFSRDVTLPTYIKIPFSNLDLSKEFNVSFVFKTTFSDGQKPQSFLLFVNDSITLQARPLYLYLPRNRVSGMYGRQHLYYENYDKNRGVSNSFLNSQSIKTNNYYFVSVNYTIDNTIQIYVNSDLYATFNNVMPHNLKTTSIIIGALKVGGKVSTRLEGVMYGLRIYKKSLSESEIVSVFNSFPPFLHFSLLD